MFCYSRPIIVLDGMQFWPAISDPSRNWKDLGYLNEKVSISSSFLFVCYRFSFVKQLYINTFLKGGKRKKYPLYNT